MTTVLSFQSALNLPARTAGDIAIPAWTPRVEKAWELAEKHYAGKTHWAGMSLSEHVLGVVRTLLPFQPDDDAVIACLLQHVLELHVCSLQELEEEFGVAVRGLISSIHLVSHVSMRSRRRSIEDVRLMLLSVSDDMRVLLTILCERCFLLENMGRLTVTERRRLSRDALSLFAPVAARLGIHSLKQRLEALAFPHMYVSDAEWITEQMDTLKQRYGDFLSVAAQDLQKALAEKGIHAVVSGREKLAYSIFSKMRSKGLSSVTGLTDLFALRVVVPSIEDCYRVLGYLHQMGRPLPNRFKDYIAFPKPNGYQSLHTTIARLPGVPEDVTAEIQIRTRSMHREAEYGVAAHWSYKEGGTANQTIQRVQLQQMLTSQQTVQGEGRKTLLVDHIYVLSPKGDVIELPEGATPLDFAFQIHSTLGLAFRAARVNGSIVPVDYELENGDMVEILTHRTPRPSPEWLQLVKMASSRTRLKRYLHTAHRDEYVQTGKVLLNEELKKRRLQQLDTDLSVMRIHNGSPITFSERQDLLMKLGQGSEKVGIMIRQFDLLHIPEEEAKVIARRPRLQRKDAIIQIDGGMTMPIRYAKCCSPAPLDRPKIIGIVTRAGDVVVHTHKCRQALRGNPERRVGVKWIVQ